MASVPSRLPTSPGAPNPSPASRERLVSAGELALMLGCSRKFIYAHSDDLGVLRLGGGPKARLRFDPVAARAALACYGSERSQGRIPNDDGQSERPPDWRPPRLPNGRPQPGLVLRSRPRGVR